MHGRRSQQRTVTAEPFRGSFVGREDDLARIDEIVSGGARLVTLLGPGGVGKTRLLHRVLGQIGGRFAAIAFCDLTDARSADDVVARIATAAGTPALGAATTTNDAVARIGRSLARRGAMLLGVDNLEQLDEAALPLFADWLTAARSLVILATSRVRLGLSGEILHRVPPLALKAGDSGTSQAMRLFEDRARAVRPELDADERATAERIVALLDGVPLAIEMAASRLAVLGPAPLLQRLVRPLAVLESVSRVASERHASLSRVLDDSWEILAPTEQTTLAELAVFVGGFTVQAAEAILSVGNGALSSIERLVDSSLLRPLSGGHSSRERLGPYEVVREYALERLTLGKRLEELRGRHAHHFAEWSEVRARRIETTGDAEHVPVDRSDLADLVDDEANIAAAAIWARGRDDAEGRALHLRLLVSLAPVRTLRGQLESYTRDLREALAAFSEREDGAGEQTLLRARGELALARLLHDLGLHDEARRTYESAYDASRAAGDTTRAGLALCGLGRLTAGLGEWSRALELFAEARSLPSTAPIVGICARAFHAFYGSESGASSDVVEHVRVYVEACRRGSDPRELVLWTVQLGRVESELTRARVRAEALLSEGLALGRALGDVRGEGFALFGLGAHRMAFGPRGEAVSMLLEAASLLREAGFRRYEAWARGFLGVTYALEGAFAAAIPALDEAIELLRYVGDTPRESLNLAYRGAIAARRGDDASARRDVERARSLAPPSSRYHTWTIDLCGAHLELDDAEGLLDRAGWFRGLRDEACEWPWGEEFYEPRLAAELLEAAVRASHAPPAAVRIATDGSSFSVPSGEVVVVPGRGKLHKILLALAHARLARPGEPVPPPTLIAAAWGNERMQRQAASNRLHVALDQLRKIGLREALVRGNGGWCLDASVEFSWIERS